MASKYKHKDMKYPYCLHTKHKNLIQLKFMMKFMKGYFSNGILYNLKKELQIIMATHYLLWNFLITDLKYLLGIKTLIIFRSHHFIIILEEISLQKTI